jgi:hypothetical protein
MITAIYDFDKEQAKLSLSEKGNISPSEQEILIECIRNFRDSLLKQSDWWVLPDRTPTQAQLDYRQALRDLPANSTPALDENGNLTGVTWPVKPE